jgi:trans-2,3-dihydro-3-hydroxyanthranilate isomerase
VFVLPAEKASQRARLRIFTPATELPFAGHPTVGTAVLLNRIDGGSDRKIVLEEGIGPVQCTTAAIGTERGRARFELPRLPEEVGPAPSAETIAAALGLKAEDIGFDDFKLSRWSAGISFTFVPVRGLDAIRRCQPNLANWQVAFEQDGRSSAMSSAARPSMPAPPSMPACSRHAWGSQKIRRQDRPPPHYLVSWFAFGRRPMAITIF